VGRWLQDNVCHADLHPGNLIVQAHSAPDFPPLIAWLVDRSCRLFLGRPACEVLCQASLTIVDAGMTTTLRRPHFEALLRLYAGIIDLDGREISAAMLALRHMDSSVDVDFAAFQAEMERIFRNVDRDFFRNRTHDVVAEVLECMRRHKITMDGAASSVLMTTLALEGWASKLDPDIRILETISGLIPGAWGRRIPYVIDKLLYADIVDM
jgi:aarF domain-containing kinase